MRLIAIDVGMGTQDILLYDSKRSIENCFKLVLPSQTQIVAQRISRETRLKHDIMLTGETMGGGPCSAAVQKHIEANLTVFATERAALTLNDDLDKVKEMGVVIVSDDEANESVCRIEFCDVDKGALEKALSHFGISLPENFAVAVQDHGYSPSVSNRIFRFQYLSDIIKRGGALNLFVYKNNIPPRFSRMKAIERTLPAALIMDTGIAAIRGAIRDENAKPPYLVVNIGNGHTLASVVDRGSLLSLFEHHTNRMTADKLDSYLERLCSGTLDFQEVFDDGGHGCFVRESIELDKLSILVTGPKRGIMRSSRLNVRFAAPFGDMMLTGCFGLLGAYLNYIPE
jgi:uncharacterized protein (DUF1786 family)